MVDSVSTPGIAFIATHLPARIVDNDELVQRLGFDREFLTDKVGVRSRHIAAADEAVSDMAIAAARKLFASGAARADEIGLLILCTQNPDYRLPTTANIVQAKLGLPNSTIAFDINQGCSGFVYGLAIAQSLMLAHEIDVGLLITAEAYSKVVNPNDRATAPLFGDAAAATLLRRGGPGQIGKFSFGGDGSGADALMVPGGGSRHPDRLPVGPDALHMNGRAIFEFMMRRIPGDIRTCVARNGLDFDQIDLFLCHQASRYMVRALAKALGVDERRAPVDIEDVGNTVSCSLPLLIDRLGGVAALRGKTALLSGFGVGLSWASTVVRFSHSGAS
jgi:3-oxoacyl-[acyl-carrier-protein] synthase-3